MGVRIGKSRRVNGCFYCHRRKNDRSADEKMMTAWQPPPWEKEVICRRYVQRVTGYSRVQVARLIGQYQKGSQIRGRKGARHCFERLYTAQDVRLLAKTDELRQWLGCALGASPSRSWPTWRAVTPARERVTGRPAIAGCHSHRIRRLACARPGGLAFEGVRAEHIVRQHYNGSVSRSPSVQVRPGAGS